MGVTIDGESITITNATIQVINGANSETGVSYIIITPEGGTGSLPFMSQGLPGQSTLFDMIQFVWHPHGETLPTPNVEKELVSAGGPGEPARYNMTIHGNVGPTGLTGSPSIGGSSDLAGEPALGEDTDQYVLVYTHATGKFTMMAQKVGDDHVSAPIPATPFNNANPRLLTSIAIPPKPFAYRPKPSGLVVGYGTDGVNATRVNLYCRIDNAAGGVMCGYGRGVLGANLSQIPTIIVPAYSAAAEVPGPTARIPAGVGATVHLRAEQVQNVSSSWMTAGSPDSVFMVHLDPVM